MFSIYKTKKYLYFIVMIRTKIVRMWICFYCGRFLGRSFFIPHSRRIEVRPMSGDIFVN
ncbi:hypothetical protein LEP1GSC062_1862 [Leptospira alexanderi serovar Manhao 3 str. L 60]|uniref:Uncharacterized protein n=1 Tax=Leptospira alexanderi serovar Manhao 3 str. L 60 TaxID=1049759 RepID=V6HV44_9LEPT|nr:hypothetical protein LEP1GSC062_1862 [Leptospira alexanderi serovar Manhao 3 str. L 60]